MGKEEMPVLKIQKQVLEFDHKFFREERYKLLFFQIYDDISTFSSLITLFNMPKGLVT